MKSNTFQQVCIKFSLYLLVTVGAMSLAYLFGFYPYIKAQNTQVSATAVNNQAVNSQSVSATVAPLDNQAASNNPAPSVDVPAVDYVPKINPYKFTTSYIGDITSDEKDPFRKPRNLLDLEEEAARPKRIQDNQIDEKMEAIRRWPLQQYKLIAVIWDVSNPKAMIADPDGKKHLLKKSYRIGDQDGLITNISEGSITVLQGNVPVVVALYKE